MYKYLLLLLLSGCVTTTYQKGDVVVTRSAPIWGSSDGEITATDLTITEKQSSPTEALLKLLQP